MDHPKSPNEDPVNAERNTAPGVGEYQPWKLLPLGSAPGTRALADEEAGATPKAQGTVKPVVSTEDPYKRVTFKIANEDFAKFVGHKPTPEALERLFDTTTLARMFARRNADGARKWTFVWRRWMWMPVALLIAASFAIGGQLATSPFATSATPESRLDGDRVLSATVRPARRGKTVASEPAKFAVTVDAASPSSVPVEEPPKTRALPPTEPKPVHRPISQSQSVSKTNGESASNPFEATPFTPVD